MENQKEYLKEEQYLKANKKVKTAGSIMMILGIAAILSGIVMLIVGSDEIRGLGGIPLVLGIGVTIWGCMIRFLYGNMRQINAYMAQQQMPVVQEGAEKVAPTAGKVATAITKGIKEGLKDNEE